MHVAQHPAESDSAPMLSCAETLHMLSRQIESYAQDMNTLLKQREETKQALRDVRLDALLRLSAVAELKDSDTGTHLVRMGHYSALIARTLGQPALWCDNMLYASRMHDIGKIGIPDSILKKPGPLTPEEWQVMKRHSEIGAEVLGGSESPLYRMAAEVALGHHERYAGTGYPAGRKGEDIPLSARIVAVADFFDAMTSERCYHQALPPEQAFEIVRKSRGSHFGPAVTDAFLSVTRQVLELRAAINAGEIEPAERSPA